jgi:hypothetical protein
MALGSLHLFVLAKLAVRNAAKIAAILLMSALYIFAFYRLEGLLGWSAAVAVPERFKLLATRVVEPDVAHGTRGAIHVWAEELDDRNIPSGVPRAYLLPYSVDLASRANLAQSEINKGHAQGGTAQLVRALGAGALEGANVRSIGQSGVAPGGDPSGGGLLDPAALGGQSKSVDLIPLPPPLLPPKDDP